MRLYLHYELLKRKARTLGLSAAARQFATGGRVLDAGTGTGVLSILSAKAGAREVVGVDRMHLSLARSLAEENGVGDRVRFVEGDILAQSAEDLGGLFDVVFALLYFNDVRRDEGQITLAREVYRRFLRQGGEPVPDAVRYRARVYEWPEMDAPQNDRDVSDTLADLERTYGLSLRALHEGVRNSLDAKTFPRRLEDGLLEGDTKRALGPSVLAFEVDYRQEGGGMPTTVSIPVTEPGKAHVVLWMQELMHRGQVLFANESLTWIASPVVVSGTGTISVALDELFRETNRVTASFQS